MKIVTHAPAQRPTRRSARRRSTLNATVDDQTDVITFCALTRRRIVSALWQVFLQKQLEIREEKAKVLATWIRDVITHDLGRWAPFIDVVAPDCARVLMSARLRSSHVLAVSSSFKHILCSSPAGAFTEYITRAPIGCMGFVWEHSDSFLHCVASPFHSFVTTHWVSLASWHCGTTF